MTVPTHTPTPAGPDLAESFASGPAPYRTLVLGGPDLLDGDRVALADGIALGLAERTGHGIDVETVVVPELLGASGGDLLAGRDLTRIDAVVVALAPHGDAAAQPSTVRALLEPLAQRLTVGAAVVAVIPSPRTAGLAARTLDAFAAVVHDAAGSLVPVVRLEDAPGTTKAERTAGWAAEIATATSAALIDPMVRFLPDDPYDEDRRVDAVLQVGRSYTEWPATFDDLVEAARSTYGTPAAAMSIIDDETTRYFARSGNVAVSLPRGKTVCNRVMRIYGGLILGDARLDHRFSTLPEVKTGDVRFYAGYRITTPDGAPFGALCVFDSEPREVQEADLTALRDLALDAQRRLGALIRERSAA